MMQIREGAWYLMENGDAIGPAARDIDDDHGRWHWNLANHYYDDDGLWCCGAKLGFDLLEEVEPTQTMIDGLDRVAIAMGDAAWLALEKRKQCETLHA